MNQSPYKTILAIESSCDETAAAVVENGTRIRSSSIASSAALHAKYGGIVPEVAAREQLDCIIPTLRDALEKANESYESIDAIAVTHGPGLIGSLLVGVETAKTIALATNKPLIPVNHVLAHMYANFFQSKDISFPAISLVVSGGHTELYRMDSTSDIHWLGGTLDDAAGECFDKTARLLGYGHEGGVAIQKIAQKSRGIKLPRPLNDVSSNFSFSGLKTAALRLWEKTHDTQGIAYEVQEAITDVLVKKTLNAAQEWSTSSILLSGGVAANLRLREKFTQQILQHSSNITLHVPPVSLCTDNAAYIGSYAYFRGIPVDWHKITAIPDLNVEV